MAATAAAHAWHGPGNGFVEHGFLSKTESSRGKAWPAIRGHGVRRRVFNFMSASQILAFIARTFGSRNKNNELTRVQMRRASSD